MMDNGSTQSCFSGILKGAGREGVTPCYVSPLFLLLLLLLLLWGLLAVGKQLSGALPPPTGMECGSG